MEDVPIVKGDKVMMPYFGGSLTFQVIATAPAANHLLVTKKTAFTVSESDDALAGISHVTYEDIGGLNEEIKEVREMIELPLRHPEIFEKLGIEAPNGMHCIVNSELHNILAPEMETPLLQMHDENI